MVISVFKIIIWTSTTQNSYSIRKPLKTTPFIVCPKLRKICPTLRLIKIRKLKVTGRIQYLTISMTQIKKAIYIGVPVGIIPMVNFFFTKRFRV